MKRMLSLIAVLVAASVCASGQVAVDQEAFGKSLGGWNKRGKKAAEYPLSGSTYRTFRPEITPTPNGGIFVSVRIDHVRGIFSSDDHATLEVTIDSQGFIESAQSNIAIQGRSISSDVILGTTQAGQAAVGVDRAVQIGTDLVANLSAKLLREKIVESGRVTFPAAVRHNYNLLFQAIRMPQPVTVVDDAVGDDAVGDEEPAAPAAPGNPENKEANEHTHANLDFRTNVNPPKLNPTQEKPQGGN